jgi:hypothetical protein
MIHWRKKDEEGGAFQAKKKKTAHVPGLKEKYKRHNEETMLEQIVYIRQ